MNIELELRERSALLRLSGDASIRDARGLHAKLGEASLASESIDIDASQITSLDTSLVQLFIAAKESCPTISFKLPGGPEPHLVLAQCGALEALSDSITT